jgi:hypothetical protein
VGTWHLSKGKRLLARMKEYFVTYNTSWIKRTDRSLCSPWATILAECQKCSCMLAQVERINLSGTNEKDRIICFVNLFYFLCEY